MSDDGYATLPKTTIEVRDVTASFGKTLAKLLARDTEARKLDFPRLRFPGLPGIGYAGNDYWTIANRIGPDRIEVYETRLDEGLGFQAQYKSYGGLNFFVVTPKVTVAPLLAMATIVHEATHAIQDWRKWRMSGLDREVDAHFAEALYLLRTENAKEAEKDTRMTRFMIAAKAYDEDERYLTSCEFRELRGDMRHDIFEHYSFMMSIFGPQPFDPEQFSTDFRKRFRWDGIPER